MGAWLLLPVLAAAAPAPASPPADAPRAVAPAPPQRDRATKPEAHAPDPAVLEYLGLYAEAADGVDPLAFVVPADAGAGSNLTKEKP